MIRIINYSIERKRMTSENADGGRWRMRGLRALATMVTTVGNSQDWTWCEGGRREEERKPIWKLHRLLHREYQHSSASEQSAWSCGLQTWRTGSAARASLTMVIVSETVLCNRANKIEKRSPRAIAEMCGAQGMRAKHGSAKTSRQRNQWAIEKHQRCYIISNRGHPSSPSLSFRCK